MEMEKRISDHGRRLVGVALESPMLRCPLVHLEDIQAYNSPSQLSSIRWAIRREAYTRRTGKKHKCVDEDGGALIIRDSTTPLTQEDVNAPTPTKISDAGACIYFLLMLLHQEAPPGVC